MDFIFDVAGNAIEYIKRDFKTNRVRFFLEVFAWACSVVSAVIFAMTVPNIPIVLLYSIFISGCSAMAYTCWTRGSFGLLANYVFLIVIDAIGLSRMLFGW